MLDNPFANSKEGLRYALCVDATNQSIKDIVQYESESYYHQLDMQITAMLQARLYKELWGE